MNRQLQRIEVRNIIRDILNVLIEDIESEITEEYTRPKRLWERKWIEKRARFGASNCVLRELADEDPDEYFRALRMTRESFIWLLGKVAPFIEKLDTVMRPALTTKLKPEIVLYMLATGNNVRSLQHFFRVSKSSISLMIPEVCNAIYTVLEEYIQVPRTQQDWKAIEAGFRKTWNFPGCCGAIDGKHIVLKAPTDAGSYYYNYKHQNSIVLMVVADDDYCFQYIDIGCNGRVSDGGLFRNCNLRNALENNMLPENHFIVGDAAFPLKKYLMKPYGGNQLSEKENVFNYRLSRARRIIENCFGILISRFRIIGKPLSFSPEKVEKIVKACCALHNWLRKTKSPVHVCTLDVEDAGTANIISESWRNMPRDGLVDLPRSLKNRTSQDAPQFRENYADFFIGEGAVDWQWRMIH